MNFLQSLLISMADIQANQQAKVEEILKLLNLPAEFF